MKWIFFLLFVSAAVVVSCAGQDETTALAPDDKRNDTTTPPHTTSTAQHPNTTTSTQTTHTTHEPNTTTTTHEPNTTTTTHEPNTTTTTHKPNTTTTSPETTTTPQSPNTTTTPAPATTTAVPPVKQGSWKVYSPNKTSICILFNAALEFNIPEENPSRVEENPSRGKGVHVVVPTDARAYGSCDQKVQSITLQWDSVVKEKPNLVEFVFTQNKTAKTSEVASITASLELGNGEARAMGVGSRMNLTATPSTFGIRMNDSYKCTAEETVKMSKNATLLLSSVQFQAFRTTNDTKFGIAAVCEADKKSTSDIVPIAVGCALAALVVIILIAYLIGRRRSRQKGYQSV